MAAATLASVTPTTGALTGGTVLTVTGTLLTQSNGLLYLRATTDGYLRGVIATSTTATTIVATTADMTGHGGPCDVGIFDTVANGYVWLYSAFYAGTAAPAAAWDQALWDGGSWQQQRFPPGAGWAYDWRVWYQYQGQIQWDMTAATVEVRWSTDAHTIGDGTYRGDIQPGSMQMRIYDPGHRAEQLSKLGTIWLHYGPSNYTWGFYLDTVTRQLSAPGDPVAADVVLAGTVWPLRLTTDCTANFTRPAERTDTRLTALATFLSQNATLNLPRYDAAIASQSQTVAAIVPVTWTTGITPAVLTMIRVAAADGVAWVSADVDGAGVGKFKLNYARWDTLNAARALGPSDIVAGVPFDSTMNDVITHVEWDGVNASGVATTYTQTSTLLTAYGEGKVTMRVWGDVSGTGAEVGAVGNTGQLLLTKRANPTLTKLSAVTAISGKRTTRAGADSTPWNPAAHVWSPVDAMYWTQTGWETNYWVISTAHRLTVAAWESAHTVELRPDAAALPA